MKKILISCLTILLLCAAVNAYALSAAIQAVVSSGGSSACAASFIEDAFTRGDNATVGGDWTAETDTGGLLAISSNTLLLTHSATTAAYVSFTKAAAVTTGYAVFKFKVSDIHVHDSSGTSNYLAMFRDGSDEIGLQVYGITTIGGNWDKIQIVYRADTGSYVEAGIYDLNPSADTWYWFKIYWNSATDVDTSDGDITLWTSTDGTNYTQRFAVTNLDFYTYADLKYFRLGNIVGIWNQTDYTMSFDDVEWRADDCFN